MQIKASRVSLFVPIAISFNNYELHGNENVYYASWNELKRLEFLSSFGS